MVINKISTRYNEYMLQLLNDIVYSITGDSSEVIHVSDMYYGRMMFTFMYKNFQVTLVSSSSYKSFFICKFFDHVIRREGKYYRTIKPIKKELDRLVKFYTTIDYVLNTQGAITQVINNSDIL